MSNIYQLSSINRKETQYPPINYPIKSNETHLKSNNIISSSSKSSSLKPFRYPNIINSKSFNNLSDEKIYISNNNIVNISNKNTSSLNSKNNIQNLKNNKKENGFDKIILHRRNKSQKKITNRKLQIFDSETLYNNNLQLQTEIKNIQNKINAINSESKIKEKELIRNDSLIKELLRIPKDDYDIKNIPNKKIPNSFSLFNKITKQYNILKKENETKNDEIKNLKKNYYNSKTNELNIENNILNTYLTKLKNLNLHMIEKNNMYNKRMKNLNGLENDITSKNFFILRLQESLKENSALNIKYEKEIDILKERIKEYEKKNRDLKINMQNLDENFHQILLEKKEIEDKYFLSYNQFYGYGKNNFNKISEKYRNSKKQKENSPNLQNQQESSFKNYENNPKSSISNINNNILIEEETNNITNNDTDPNSKSIKNNIENDEIIIDEKINDENTNNYDITESTYILIKNFEALDIDKKAAFTDIIKPILNILSDEKQIEKEKLINLFSEKICTTLNCLKNNSDVDNINNLINSVLVAGNNDLSNFIENFLHIFDGVRSYNDSNENEKNMKIINTTFVKEVDFFKNRYLGEMINFREFKDLLNEKNIVLEDDAIEYLIYRMKKDCIIMGNCEDEESENIISIFDLCYKTFLNMIIQ